MGRLWFSWLTFLWSIKPNYSETFTSFAPIRSLTDTDMIIPAQDNILSFQREMSPLCAKCPVLRCPVVQPRLQGRHSDPSLSLRPLSGTMHGCPRHEEVAWEPGQGQVVTSSARVRLSSQEPVLSRCTGGRAAARPATGATSHSRLLPFVSVTGWQTRSSVPGPWSDLPFSQ